MKRYGLVVLLALLLVAPAVLAAEEGGQQAAPSLVMEETAYDAGEVLDAAVIQHIFIVKNKGEGPLEILKVRPG